MTDKTESLHARLEHLEEELLLLKERVDYLAGRVDGAQQISLPSQAPLATPPENVSSSTGSSDWLESSLLPRISALCFLLVIALALRTVTDKGLVPLEVGSLLGISFAGVLILLGWRAYIRSQPLSPIFVSCGAILMFSIIMEAHARFGWLPNVQAYGLILITGICLTALGLHQKRWLPSVAGVLGACLAAVVVDFPDPNFPLLISILLVVHVGSRLIQSVKGCGVVSWVVLPITLLTTLVWQSKLSISPALTDTHTVGLELFVPLIILMAIVNIIIALAEMFRVKDADTVSFYSRALPVINVAWAFAMLNPSVSFLQSTTFPLAAGGTAAGIGHLGLSFGLARYERLMTCVGTPLFLAGALLLALWLPIIVGLLISLPILSALACAGALLYACCGLRGIRFFSYLIQLYSCLMLAVLSFKGNIEISLATFTSVVVVMLFSFGQYYIERRRSAGKGGSTPVLLLLLSLFCALSLLHLLTSDGTPGWTEGALGLVGTVMINTAAACLMVFAFRRNDVDARKAGIIVLIIGGLKVFLFDMFTSSGISFLVSVLSFGLAVAVYTMMLKNEKKK